MDHISELRTTLAHFFNWNKSRLACLAQMIQALICVRTINLTQIAAAFQADCKEESTYRRICRFFTDFTFDLSAIAPFILKLFSLDHKCILIFDRTSWKWGKTPINILMLSIGYKGISIPFFWSVLDLEGNSCLRDRTSLFKRALKRFPADRIEVFLADREFVGKEWFNYLIQNKIPFIIRVKDSYLIKSADDHSLKKIRAFLKQFGRKKKVCNLMVEMWGKQLFLSFQKGRKGSKEPMILVSNRSFQDPLKLYRKRWGIETLFGCLKTRGFRLEDTHVTDPDKIERMIFVLTLAFCWALRAGEFKCKEAPIKRKAHGRKAKSIFRYGLDLISRGIRRIRDDFSEFLEALNVLIFEVSVA